MRTILLLVNFYYLPSKLVSTESFDYGYSIIWATMDSQDFVASLKVDNNVAQ